MLFKCTEALGYFPVLELIPSAIVDHIRAYLSTSKAVDDDESLQILQLSKATLYERYQPEIRARLGLHLYTSIHKENLQHYLVDATQTQHSTVDLINAAVDWLLRERIELPAFATLRRICSKVNNAKHESIQKAVVARLPRSALAKLDALLSPSDGKLLAEWARIREKPGPPTLSALREYLDHDEWVWSLGDFSVYVADVPKPKLRHYSAEARELAASDLANFSDVNHRYVIMIAAIIEAGQESRDVLARFFCKRMFHFEKQAQVYLDDAHLRQRNLVEHVVRVFRDVLVALEERSPIKFFKAIWAIIKLAGSRETLIEACNTILGKAGKNHLPHIWQYFKSNRTALFQLVRSLPLQSTTDDTRLVDAVKVVLRDEDIRTEFVKPEFSIGWASERWRALVLGKVDGKTVYRKDSLELCVFTHLAHDLRSGDIAVEGSAEHADYRKQLLAGSDIIDKLPAYSVATGISVVPQTFSKDLRQLLETAINEARIKLSIKPLRKRKDGEWTLGRYEKRSPSPQFAALESIVHQHLISRGVIEIMVNADELTQFSRHFGPPAGTAPKIQDVRKRHLLTAFTYGTGLGPTQVAKHLREVMEPKEIAYINRHHFSSDQLLRANADLINLVNRLPLSTIYGDGNSAGVDGTYIAIRDKNLVAEFHFRYRKLGGIKHQLISNKYVALFSTFIPCSAWEATYLLDMVFGNKSDIRPKKIYGDTQAKRHRFLACHSCWELMYGPESAGGRMWCFTNLRLIQRLTFSPACGVARLTGT